MLSQRLENLRELGQVLLDVCGAPEEVRLYRFVEVRCIRREDDQCRREISPGLGKHCVYSGLLYTYYVLP